MEAKLLIGETYVVMGHHFKQGVSQKVNKEVSAYLKGNKQFELSGQQEKSKPEKESKKDKE